jgi:hypothetical protein
MESAVTDPTFEAAAMHGLATNLALPIADRLACALQALDLYEKIRAEQSPEVEELGPSHTIEVTS